METLFSLVVYSGWEEIKSIMGRPVELFISYSHLDRKHLEKLRSHLAGLERSSRIHCWWDGLVEFGKQWEPQILEALQRADMVLILLTSNFLRSDYCVENELLAAREREKQGEIDLLPILVESFDLGAHWIGQLQAITINGKSITQSRLGSVAWESVAKQIRLKVECMEGKRPVMHVLNEVDKVVHSGDIELSELPSSKHVSTANFPTVSAFWKTKSTILRDLDLAKVQGTVSQFAPMLMGSPRAKRVLHREFRKAIETHRRFGELKRLTINACMSISAGQMVHHEVRDENKKRLLGLYESIVRNSIPIFVLSEYYDHNLIPALRDTEGNGCFEAIVTGRPFLLDNNFIRRFLARQGIDQIIPPYVIDDLCRDAYALEVGGPDTGVQKLENMPVRYIDGDIWIVASSEGTERFITTFLDITNEVEREEELNRLREEAGNSRIVAAYNELHSVSQLLEKND
ncbi:MAG: toll/interleukin-1 receptor domain-containing protein [bacterium]